MSFWKKPGTPDAPPSSGTPLPFDHKSAPQPTAAALSASPKAPAAPPEASPPIAAAADKTEELINSRFGKIRSALGQGTVIQGKLSFDTPVRIDGRLSGEVYSSKALIVGKTGQIDAQLEVASLIVMGSVSGKVKATERVEVWASGKLTADITTPVLVIADGSIFSGSCAMPGVKKA